MKIIKKISPMKAEIKRLKSQGKVIGLVPTMGCLHQGHLSLVRACRRRADTTVVSIFVNPTQFGPEEDFKKYPRDIRRDLKLLEIEGADYVFYPEVKEMYPEGTRTAVEVHGLQDRLCGRSRPGHFRGVCTVVLKLFNIVTPDLAFFGQKDAQQALIIRRMVRDLDLDVKIRVMPIIREKNGLARSSRNAYLSPEERKAATVLTKSLKEAKMLIARGERRPEVIIDRMKEIINMEPRARIDYVEVVDLDELNPVKELKSGGLIALAVHIGKTRLIDNTVIGLRPRLRSKR